MFIGIFWAVGDEQWGFFACYFHLVMIFFQSKNIFFTGKKLIKYWIGYLKIKINEMEFFQWIYFSDKYFVGLSLEFWWLLYCLWQCYSNYAPQPTSVSPKIPGMPQKSRYKLIIRLNNFRTTALGLRS
jgi:hypothetical protein